MISGEAPTLKCVICASSPDLIEQELVAIAGAENVRRVSGGSCLVWTPETTSAIRDQLASLGGEVSLLIMEFETWSGYAIGSDAGWLTGRGH